MDVAHRLAPAVRAVTWLGQDEFNGRDELTRLLWGARVSLAVAFSASAAGLRDLGTALRCWRAAILATASPSFVAVRSMDVVLCFPPLLLALLVVALTGPGAGDARNSRCWRCSICRGLCV